MFSPIYYYHILYDLRVPSIIVILARFFIILCFFLCPRHCIRRCRCGRHAYKKKIKKRGRVSVACRSFNVTPVPFYFRAPVFGEFCFIFLNAFIFVPSPLSGPIPFFTPLLFLRAVVSGSKLGSDPAGPKSSLSRRRVTARETHAGRSERPLNVHTEHIVTGSKRQNRRQESHYSNNTGLPPLTTQRLQI